MFDKNMFRPKSTLLLNSSTQTSTTNRTITTTTTRKRSLIWVIVQLCFILIQILSSSVSPINCDKQTSLLTPATTSSSPSSALNFIRSHNGDKLLHRITRVTKLDQYALLEHNNNSTNEGAGVNYMAHYGLRTRFQPQKFYSKKERTTAATAQKKDNLVSLNLVSEPPKDICNSYCHCERKNAKFTVSCDYQKTPGLSPIFDRNYKVPNYALIIKIKLAPKTQFQLNEGFLNNTMVNRFIIEGNMNSETVEINSNAFSENNGPYPEIGLYNVSGIVIRNKAFYQKVPASYKFDITNSNDEPALSCKFNISNSNEVILLENAFENTSIKGKFVAIKDLRINEKAFKSAKARLHIEASNIDNIFRFEASMQEIRFVNCTIGTINPGAFDVYDINLLTFESCRIDAIKSKAITEKFYSKTVSIIGASIGLIESDAIFRSGINELKIANNKIETIHDNAIHVNSAFVTITGNEVKYLGNNWLHVEKWSKFVVKNNQFGVFGRMLLDNEQSSTSCSFEGNSLTEPKDGSLNFTKPYCKIREVSVNLRCRCDLKWVEKLTDKDLRSEIYCTIDDKLRNCFNASTFNFMKYLNEVCDESKVVLDCVANRNLKKIEGRFYTAEELERKQQHPQLIMILAGAILLLILLIALVTFFICLLRQRASKLHGVASSAERRHVHEFSHEERCVIEQTLQLIQKKYPEIYKNIHKRVQILYIQDLSDNKCIDTTSEIVNILNRIKNPGIDFIAFNRVLTEHLQTPSPSAPPADQTPIYSEPSLTGMDEGFYTSTTFSQMEGSAGAAGTVPEHIYAEPSCAQQPLLPNEYASPADGHLTTMDLYTEPINERETNLTTAPYAVTGSIARTYQSPYRPLQYATPMRNQQHQHIQQRQLPDILAPSSSTNSSSTGANTTLSNVRKIAQDLQEKTNFNPIAKPRNLHLVAPPTYTAPNKSHKQLLNQKQNLTAGDNIEMDMRGATALPPQNRTTNDAGSNHSGGSNETVQIDDVIEYVDS